MAILSSSLLLPISLLPAAARAATVTYDFDVDWTYANPDGQQNRPVIGINRQWPIPPIVATKGDQVIVNVKNSLRNESTSLHFHGLYMNGSTHMDGPVDVTQCAILPGSSFTYNFTVDQPGTYWYHSHVRGQYPDGLRGPLIVNDPVNPFKDQYDEEIVLTFSDWYHESMPKLISGFVNIANPSGAEPVPQAALVNDTQNLTVNIEPGKTYMFRMINIGAFAAQYVLSNLVVNGLLTLLQICLVRKTHHACCRSRWYLHGADGRRNALHNCGSEVQRFDHCKERYKLQLCIRRLYG